MKKETISKVMAAMGKRGGKARAQNLTAQQLSEIGKKANAASVAVRRAKADRKAKERT